jgi:hypothetical protein
MLLIIEKEMYRKRGRTEDLDPRVQAALMLDVIEKAGMAPPTLPSDYCQAIMQVYYAGYTFHQWEESVKQDYKVMEAMRKREEIKKLTPAERSARLRASAARRTGR